MIYDVEIFILRVEISRICIELEICLDEDILTLLVY